MSDQKELGSNAYWWTRLKKPDTLKPYLRIAEGLKIPMPLVAKVDYEYDPNAKPTPHILCHKDTHHDAKWGQQVSLPQSSVLTFYKPWDSPCNIIRARNVIAEHLARNNLSLQWYIKDCDLADGLLYTNKSNVRSCDKTQPSTVYLNYWDNFDTNANSIRSESWWKNPDERTAWHSKTVAAMRARSAVAEETKSLTSMTLNEQNAQWEQEIIVAGLGGVTLETPNEQIEGPPDHQPRDFPRTCAILAAARYDAGLYECNIVTSYGSDNKTRRHTFIDDSLLVDNCMGMAYEHIKPIDTDNNPISEGDNESGNSDSDYDLGHYESKCNEGDEGNDSDNSHHFDRDRASHLAQSWMDCFGAMDQENGGLDNDHQSARTRAGGYTVWREEHAD